MRWKEPKALAIDGGGELSFAHAGREGGQRRVVWHHGLLGGVGISPVWDEMAAEANVEILTVARPGYGSSTPLGMAAISDWPALMSPLLDHLGWSKFDVVGVSAGAAYAYALAVVWPNRVRQVGICSGVSHVADPAVLALYTEAARNEYARFRSGALEEIAGRMQSFFEDFRRPLPEGHHWHSAIDASLAHGAAGPAREAQLQVRPWGFDLRDIRQPVRLWHAREDEMVPFAAAQATADKLVDATLHVQSEPQHMPSEATGRELFAYLRESRW